MYRAFEREAERLEERSARIDRVVLDYELKREYQAWLHERDRDRDDYDGHPDRDSREIEEWAHEHDPSSPSHFTADQLTRDWYRLTGCT